jgi:ribosomal protein L22
MSVDEPDIPETVDEAPDAETLGADEPAPQGDELTPTPADEAVEDEAAAEEEDDLVADDTTRTPPQGDELGDVVAEAAAAEEEDEDAPAAEDEDEDAPAAETAPAPAAPTRTPASTPRRRRARREPGAPAPVVRAQAKYVRSSARKARLVCDHIRGKSVEEARAILAVTPRAIARDWSKLLESAVANAEHNHELVGEDLYVKAVHADEGPTIKRFRPRAMGRATRIRKRTSHLTILLTPKD